MAETRRPPDECRGGTVAMASVAGTRSPENIVTHNRPAVKIPFDYRPEHPYIVYSHVDCSLLATECSLAEIRQALNYAEAELVAAEEFSDKSEKYWWYIVEYWRYVLAIKKWQLATEAAERAAKPRPKGARQRIDYAGIKARLDIVDIAERYTTLRKAGRRFVAKCPLHDSQRHHTPLTIYPDQQSFYCFSCCKGGDVIDFAKMVGYPWEAA